MARTKTAGSAINRVRGMHPAFGALNCPDAICRQQLAADQRSLVSEVFTNAPSYFGPNHTLVQTTALLPIPQVQATFDAGIDLDSNMANPDILGVREVWAQLSSDASQTGQVRVEIQPRGQRFNIGARFPYGWIDGRVFFPGGTFADWSAYSGVYATLLQSAPDFANNTTKLSLDDDCEDVLVYRLAEAMGVRVNALLARKLVDVGYFAEKGAEATAKYLARATANQRGATHRIVDVM